MVRALNTFGVLAIISAVCLIVFGVVQQLQAADAIERNLDLNIIEKFNKAEGSSENKSQKTLNPLVEQAKAYALYLNPPEPKPKPQRTRVASVRQQRNIKNRKTTSTNSRKIAAAKSTKLQPKFTLVGTSYYRSAPEKSMALVSEPGKGVHWVKKGSHLGHFIVEKVERETIVYRDGNVLRQMTVDTKDPARNKQDEQTKLATESKSQT
jgi:hypothetical protein